MAVLSQLLGNGQGCDSHPGPVMAMLEELRVPFPSFGLIWSKVNYRLKVEVCQGEGTIQGQASEWSRAAFDVGDGLVKLEQG